jgi:hypothetical protein
MDNVTDTLRSAKATRVMVGANGSRHSAVYATPDGPITATITGISSKRAAALFVAVERLLNGAYVFDGDDLKVIRDGMRIARSEISGLAPAEQSATNALGSIETALAHLEVA